MSQTKQVTTSFIDSSNFVCMPILTKSLIKNPYFIDFYFSSVNITMPNEKLDMWEAFKFTSDKLVDYSKIDPKKDVLSSRDAEEYIRTELIREFIKRQKNKKTKDIDLRNFEDPKISKNTLLKKSKEGYLRLYNGKGFIRQELDGLIVLFSLIELFKEKKVMIPTQDVSSKDVWAIIPRSMDKLGKNETDMELEVVKSILLHPFTAEIINQLKKPSE